MKIPHLALKDYRSNLLCELLFANDTLNYVEKTPIIGYNPALLNGGFETAGSGGADVFGTWTETKAGTSAISQDAVIFHSGTKSCKFVIDATGGNAQVSKGGFFIGKTYRIKFFARNANGIVGGITVSIGDQSYNTGVLTNAFVEHTAIITVRNGGTIIFGRQITISNSATIYLDSISVTLLEDNIPDKSGNLMLGNYNHLVTTPTDPIISKLVLSTTTTNSQITIVPSDNLAIAVGTKSFIVFAKQKTINVDSAPWFSLGSRFRMFFDPITTRIHLFISDMEDIQETSIDSALGEATLNEWMMLTGTIDYPNKLVKFYKNDKLIGSFALPAGASYPNTDPAYFGYNDAPAFLDCNFKVFRAYNEALDLEKIKNIYNYLRRYVLGLSPKN